MLSGSIGPQENPLGNGRFIVYGESARNGVLNVYFNPPVQEGTIESLTRQQFDICTDLKAIPNKLDWVKKQIEKLKAKQHCECRLPDCIHHLFFTHLCCDRFPDEAHKYLTTWQIQDCKALALEALTLVCVHYGFNGKDLMDDIYNPESVLWNQLTLVVEKESDSLVTIVKKDLKNLTGLTEDGMTKRYKNGGKWGYYNITESTVDICPKALNALRLGKKIKG